MTSIVLTGGGTGGHLFPAIAVAAALRGFEPPPTLSFLGPANRGERATVEAAGLPFEEVPAAPVRGRSPLGLVRSLATLARGSLRALRLLRRHRAAAVFSTGGYGSFPVSLAAWLLRRPLVVFLPDVEPGLAVRVEQRLASRLATSTPAALDHLPRAKTVVTGYPVRPEFFTVDRAAARAALGLGAGDRLVVVAGASQGSRALNDAVLGRLAGLLEAAVVVHITGQAGIEPAERARAALPAGMAARYFPAAFRHDLPAVMVAADLGVFRSGASILGEVPAAGLPAILVPGAFAGGHQHRNAAWLAARGAAEVLDEDDLTGLADRVVALLADRVRLEAMRAAARELARPGAAAEIARLVMEAAR